LKVKRFELHCLSRAYPVIIFKTCRFNATILLRSGIVPTLVDDPALDELLYLGFYHFYCR